MRSCSWRLTLGTAALAVASPLTGAAQTVGGGAFLQSYRFDDPVAAGLETIQLFATPFTLAVPLGSRLSLDASGAFARGAARSPDGQEVTLSGPTDTHVGLSAAVGVDWLVVTARASLPTGSSTHSAAEALVASVVAAELLPFTVNTWGSGGSFGGDVAIVTQAGGWGIGLASGYSVANEYEPLQDQQLGYRPGDRLQLRLALDHDLGASGTFSALVGFQRFGNDQVGGSNLFQSGSRIEGVLSYVFAVGRRSSALLYGAVSHRSKGTLLTQVSGLGNAGDSPAQQLYRLGANLRLPLGRRAALLPVAETRVFRAADGASQGWMTSAGTSLDLRIAGGPSGQRLVLAPAGQFRIGRVIVGDGLETGVVGWEAGVTLRVVIR